VSDLERVLRDWEDVPSFSGATAEAGFWASTELDTTLIRGSLYSQETTDSTAITLRMDPRMLARIKRIARMRYLNYQSMMKQWIAERIEKELRDNPSLD